jgi:hypothetical protein
MAFLPRLLQLVRRPAATSRAGVRHPTNGRRGDTMHEENLRKDLAEDPNNERAFAALAEVVRRRAAGTSGSEADPLTAPEAEHERRRAADLAVWSLAEELSGNPRAWYPLIELARLSVDDDREGAIRRLSTAADRDPSGHALAAGLELLRAKGEPGEALNLGVGHWRARDHVPQVGAHLVMAALESSRVADARKYLKALAGHPDTDQVTELMPELHAAFEANGATATAEPDAGPGGS